MKLHTCILYAHMYMKSVVSCSYMYMYRFVLADQRAKQGYN